MKKLGRNDPCLCGSGKKFKKCCESLMLGGRFKAEKVDVQSAPPQIQKTIGLTSLFQSHLAATPKKPLPPEPSGVSEPAPIVDLEKKAENLIGC
jgi:hypothetical protein